MSASLDHLLLYREVFLRSTDAVASIDLQGVYIEQNEAHRRLVGYTDAELRGRTPAIHLGGETFARIAADLQQHGRFRGIVQSRTKHGEIRDIELTAFPVPGEDGTPACFVGIKRDVTERRRSERRMAAEHAVTRILAEGTSLRDVAAPILRAICECLGWEVGAMWTVEGMLKNVEVWHAPDVSIPEFEKITRSTQFPPGIGLPGRVWESARPAWILDVVKDPNFPRAPIASLENLHGAFGFPILLGAEVLGVIEFFSREVREPDEELLWMMSAIGSQIGQFLRLRRAQAQLIRTEKLAAAGTLVAGVAHQINNPLNVIFGNLKLLGPEMKGLSPRVRRMLRDALKGAERARDIIEDFRHFARDSSEAELVNLNGVVEQTAELFHPSLGPRVRFTRRLGRIPKVRCYPGQIGQVLLNLFKNAGEAIDGKGAIRVRTSASGGWAVIEISDDGRGMSDEVQRRLFDPFFTTKDFGKGLGLGLSICATIVQNHGGRIGVTSVPGEGSTFRIELPVE